jgi:uncharacterized protein YndB with AHSA1/START domain
MHATVEVEGPVIDRPIDEVFEFVGDLENSPKWKRTKKTARVPDGPDGVGAKFAEESAFFGEKVAHESELTGLVPHTELSYATRFPSGVIERTRITLESVEEGTRIDVAVEVEIEQLPQVLAPFVALYVKQRATSRLEKLAGTFVVPEPSENGGVALVAFGVLLLATAGLRYLYDILPEGEWRTVLALLAVTLIAGALATILWRIGGKAPAEDDEPSAVEGVVPPVGSDG